jgi:hypothetical protein
MQGGHVLINIKTYPDGKFRAERKGIRHTRLQGYSYTKEFYSSKYDYEVFPDEVDYRRTLYWNPDVKTNTEGKASVSFYNNGAGRQLLIEAETMDASGALGVYTE